MRGMTRDAFEGVEGLPEVVTEFLRSLVDLADWEIEHVQAGDFDESRTRYFEEDGLLLSVTPRRQGAMPIDLIVSDQTAVLDAGFEREFKADDQAGQQALLAAMSAVRDGGLQETLVVPRGYIYRLRLADGTVMEHAHLYGLRPQWMRRPRNVITYQAYTS